MSQLFSDIGNAIGYASSGAERGRESRFAGSALDAYKNLNPEIQAQAVANPYAGLTQNAADVGAAQGALQDLAGLSHGQGLTPQAASALQAAQLSNAQQQGGALSAILGEAARSGALNSGRALAGELGADQGAQNANAQAGAEAAANSAAQRMNATGQVGQLGQSLEGQQYGENLQRAQGTEGNAQFNSAQNVAAQEATAQNALNQARGEQSAYGTLIGLNQNQAQGIQGVGSNLGDAAGQIAAAVAGAPGLGGGGGLNGLMSMFGSGGGQQPTNMGTDTQGVNFAKGGEVTTEEERMVKREEERKADQDRDASADLAALGEAMAYGGLIPGHAHGLDHEANDTVHAKLSPGEVVLPRSVTKAEDAPEKAKRFMKKVMK